MCFPQQFWILSPLASDATNYLFHYGLICHLFSSINPCIILSPKVSKEALGYIFKSLVSSHKTQRFSILYTWNNKGESGAREVQHCLLELIVSFVLMIYIQYIIYIPNISHIRYYICYNNIKKAITIQRYCFKMKASTEDQTFAVGQIFFFLEWTSVAEHK